MVIFRRSVMRLIITCIAMALIFTVQADGEASGPVGEWAYEYYPALSVLTLREDGTALYGGEELRWEDLGDTLLMTDAAGEQYGLRYEPAANGLILYLPSLFERISEIGGEGEVIGTWKAPEPSKSSYVFMEDGRFIEDGVFTGTWTEEKEIRRITLHYGQDFKDTVIYYDFSEGQLVVAYPWTVVRKN